MYSHNTPHTGPLLPPLGLLGVVYHAVALWGCALVVVAVVIAPIMAGNKVYLKVGWNVACS